MTQPTNHLLEIGREYGVSFTFFWDVGHYRAIERMKSKYPELQVHQNELEVLLKRIVANGHDLQLHIHPHWEVAEWVDGNWRMNVGSNYKLSDFPPNEREQIIRAYFATTQQFAKNKVTAFRAGGWCVQPFDQLAGTFKELGIQIDSSVMPGAKLQRGDYNFDFTQAPSDSVYSFENDVVISRENGFFTELPITTHYYSPLFFWNLYGRGRMNPEQHKMVGDGNFIAQPGEKSKGLFRGKMHHASTDGYFATRLQEILEQQEQKGAKNMVSIGHPKSCSQHGLTFLERFVQINHQKHSFIKMSDWT